MYSLFPEFMGNVYPDGGVREYIMETLSRAKVQLYKTQSGGYMLKQGWIHVVNSTTVKERVVEKGD